MLNLGNTSAIDTPNRFVEIGGRTLAYRSIGQGRPLVLCVRFRGNMDSWDPAFLDALAGHGFRVITFDYSGLGLSTGTPTYNPVEMAKDPRDLIVALGLTDVVLGGWSLGGLAAQAVLALYPDNISRVVLLGTNPPGPHVKPAEQLFYDIAGKEVNDAEDNVILFFEPKSAASREASRQSLARIAAPAQVEQPCRAARLRARQSRHRTEAGDFPCTVRARGADDHASADSAHRRRSRHHLPGRELVRAERAATHRQPDHLSAVRAWPASPVSAAQRGCDLQLRP